MSDESSNTCGCGESLTPATPLPLANPPGLSTLAYRIGTHSQFKAAMLAELSLRPELAGLTTRTDDDATVALLDGWASVLDVLTFYQERLANEAFLRTATERRSLLELARAIGYELRPGVAASAYLAFTLDEAEQAPRVATIPKGAKVQSIPGQDEQPQLFETAEALPARAEWNAMPVRRGELVIPRFGSTQVALRGTATNLKPGDVLLLVGAERERDQTKENWDLRRVTAVTPHFTGDAATEFTLVTCDRPLGQAWPYGPVAAQPKVFALRQRAALFGHNAPDWRALPPVTRNNFGTGSDWPGFNLFALARRQGLFGEYFPNADFTGTVQTRVDATLDFHADAESRLMPHTAAARWTGLVAAPSSSDWTFHVSAGGAAKLWLDGKLIAKIDSTGAVVQASSHPVSLTANEPHDLRLDYVRRGSAAQVSLAWSSARQPKQTIPAARLRPPEIYLDTTYPKIQTGGWLVLSQPNYQELYRVADAMEDAQTQFMLTGKSARVTLSGENLRLFNSAVRSAMIFAQEEELAIAEQPRTDAVGDQEIELEQPVAEMEKGRKLIVSGTKQASAETASEVAEVDSVRRGADGRLTLLLKAPLKNTYIRETVRIQGNVVLATHGESKTESLGGADAGAPFQKFELKQSPLTQVSAANASGTASTLEVRVNDVLWREAESFLGLEATERAFVTRRADDGKVTLQFGDGRTGARPATGVENLRAQYRVGLGLSGNVRAGQLSLLLSRPLGVSSVNNPLPATGGDDPESRDQARQNAPLTVLTLDRIVSLRDFEDFARAFAGIGKAQAEWVWSGARRVVFLTLAGPAGQQLLPGQPPLTLLLDAINAAREPSQHVEVGPHSARPFRISVRILLKDDYLAEPVYAAVSAALLDAFSFARREFGQSVTPSQVLAVMQAVPGVAAVDLDALCFAEPGGSATPSHALIARPARWDKAQNIILPAELLTLAAPDIELKEMKL